MGKELDKDKYYETLSRFDGYTQTITEIVCSKCNKNESIDGDDYDAIAYFYEKGWRATEKNCYCPSCRKKFNVKK